MIHRNELSRAETSLRLVRAANPTTIAKVALLLGNWASAALRYLAEAASFARELGRDPWDFAVEIGSLREMGLNNNHFRWLVCEGLVEHKQEITTVGDTRRVFQPDRPLSFSENTCFVLSEGGLDFARNGLASLPPAQETAESSSAVSRNGYGKDLLPKWDRERQELRVGDVVVKQFKVPALNQERILAAFEEEGWPVHIDDPLPPHPEQDSKRRLHDTINSLNRSQKNPLIQFSGNGNGQGIRWKLSRGHEQNGDSSACP
jgi:hypothetical protein